LLDKIVDGVSIDECSFFGVVGVKVEVEGQPVAFDEVVCELAYGVDCRLLLEGGIFVVAIEIFAVGVHAEVTVVDTVHVYHGYDHEDKHLLQEVGANIFGVC
jgi:hypothetical protein